MARLSVAQLCGASRVTRADGAKLRELIDRDHDDADPLVLDFDGVRIASVSFFDESFGLLARKYPIDELQRRVRVENIDPADRRLLNDIVQSRSRQRRLAEGPELQTGAPTDFIAEYGEIMRASPVAAISEAWRRLEKQIRSLAAVQRLQSKSIGAIVGRLAEKAVIRPATRDALLGLMQMRNVAVHNQHDEVDESRATEFLTMAGAMSWTLEQEARSGRAGTGSP